MSGAPRWLLVAAAVVLLPIRLEAQTLARGSIEGRVLMKGERAPVVGALVRISGIEDAQTTDMQGRFRFSEVAPGDHRLTVEAELIEPFETPVTVLEGRATRVRCYVTPDTLLLDEVTVNEKKVTADPSQKLITRGELDGIPGANGDVFRVVENMPGVAMGGIQVGYAPEGLAIRGTGPEDSKYYFNGFEIPQLFHFGALISVINAELIDDIAYSPGGFGARYGDAIGGYVNVTGRSPRSDRFGGAVDLSTYSAFAMGEGPIGRRGAGAVAVRRSTIDYVLPKIVPEEEAAFTVSPRFYDTIAQFEYRPNGSNRLSLSALGTYDHTELLSTVDENEPFSPDTFDIEIGWQSAIMAWNFTPNSRVSQTLAAQFLYLENQFLFGGNQSVRATVYSASLLDEFSVNLGNWNELRAGAQGAAVSYDTSGVLPLLPKEGDLESSWTNADATRFSDDSRTWTADGWIEDVLRPTGSLQFTPGVRVSHMKLIDDTTVDPRLDVRIRTGENGVAKAAAGAYHQWPDRDEMLPKLGNPRLNAEVSYQAVAGYEYEFGNGYALDAQSYYKSLDHLVSRTGPDEDVPYANTGRGTVYGAELFARKRLTDRLFGWISYTYSVSRRQDAPEANWRYFDEDQTHNFIVVSSYELGARKLWKIGGRWQIATGKPYTPIESTVYNAETDSYLPIYSDAINSRRERPFHQLDVRLDKRWIFNTWTLNGYLDLQNVYWQRYPIGYRYNFDYSERKAVSYPTFVPSFGLLARF